MLNDKGFDLWADGYDQSVGLAEEEGSYPFAGYREILNEIYHKIQAGGKKTVLDIGFGTGTLAAKLYEQGHTIWGQDFSERMLKLAKAKMPEARLYQGDFSNGLIEELKQNRYDAIVATYSLHHLPDRQKIRFLMSLLPLLQDGGCIYIGDVVFDTRADLERQKEWIGEEWDEEEFYFIVSELAEVFPQIKFQRFSFCAGLFCLEKAETGSSSF